jgi:hypothetical protein
MTENCKLRKAILSAFYNISQRNFGIYITNFVTLFQAVIKFLSRLVEFKILVNWGMVHSTFCTRQLTPFQPDSNLNTKMKL